VLDATSIEIGSWGRSLLQAKEERLAQGWPHTFMKNLYLDELAVGGGEDTGMFRQLKKAAGRVGPSGFWLKFFARTDRPRSPPLSSRFVQDAIVVARMDKISPPGHRGTSPRQHRSRQQSGENIARGEKNADLLMTVRQAAGLSVADCKKE
jgi:hypothetical protein